MFIYISVCVVAVVVGFFGNHLANTGKWASPNMRVSSILLFHTGTREREQKFLSSAVFIVHLLVFFCSLIEDNLYGSRNPVYLAWSHLPIA